MSRGASLKRAGGWGLELYILVGKPKKKTPPHFSLPLRRLNKSAPDFDNVRLFSLSDNKALQFVQPQST